MKRVWWRHWRTVRHDERGSALLIALVMIFVVTLFVGAILAYAGTGLRVSSSVTSTGKSQYAADGGVDASLQYLRSHTNACDGAQGSVSGAFDLGRVADQPAVHVRCTRTNADSAGPGNGGGSSDAPLYALETLGQRANQPSQAFYYNWNWLNLFSGSGPPPWGNIVESGVFVSPAVTGCPFFFFICIGGFTYKSSGNVCIDGNVFSNSTISAYNPASGPQLKLQTAHASNNTCDNTASTDFGFKVRESCGIGGNAAIVPSCVSSSVAAPSAIIGYNTGGGTDPGFPARTAMESFPAVSDYVWRDSTHHTVPQCPLTGTLVTFQPGRYTSAKDLNTLFRTCTTADGTGGMDYWFQPGSYIFDFQDTDVNWDAQNSSQYCGTGLDNPPIFQTQNLSSPGNIANLDVRSAFEHQWCIRGKYASDGNVDDFRPHIVGGTPQGWSGNPISSVLAAAIANSTDFSNPNNAKLKDGSVAVYNWSAAANAMVPQAAASADFAPVNNAKVIDGLLASLSVATSITTQTPGSAASSDFVTPNNARLIDAALSSLGLTSANQSQSAGTATTSNVSGGPDFANTANASGSIDGTVSSSTLASLNQNQAPGSVTTTDFAPSNNARVIDGQLATASVASTSQNQNAGTATSSAVGGSNDFGTTSNAQGAPNGTVSSAIVSSATTNQVPGSASSSDFASPNNGRAIDGSLSGITIGSSSTTQTAGTAATSSASGSPDFASTANATGAINGSLSSTTWNNHVTMQPTVATSSQLSGSNDFASPNNGMTINGTTTSATINGSGSVGPSNATADDGGSFNNRSNAYAISGATMNNGNSASFTSSCSFGVCPSAELRVNGYPTIPAGSTPASVSFTYRQFESSTSVGNLKILVQNSANTTLCTISPTPTSSSNAASVTVNIGPAATGGNNCVTTAAQLNGIKFAYDVQATGFFTSTNFLLDGITLTFGYTDTANRTLALSSETPPLASGAILNAATLNIAHQETGVGANPRLVLSGPNISANVACNTIALTTRAALTTDPIDVLAQLTGPCGIAAATIAATLNGLTATYTANVGGAGTATVTVDGIGIATLTTADTAVRTLTLSNLTPAVSASGTNTIDNVTVSFAHQETGNGLPAGGLSPTLVVTPGGGGTCTFPITMRSSLTTDTFDLTSCLSTPAKVNGASYAYQVHMTNTGAAQDAVASVDGVSAVTVSTDGATHTLALSAPAPAVPAGNILDTLTLSFAHQETGGASNPTLIITPGGAGACAPIALTPRPALTTDTLTIPAGCLNTIAKLNGATYQYQVHLVDSGASQSATTNVDGLKLAVVSTDQTARTLTLSNMTPAVSASSTNTVDSLSVTFAHQETGAALSPTLVITPGGAGACAPIALTPSASLIGETVTIPANCLNTIAKINGATYQYQVHLTDAGASQTGTGSVDAVNVAVLSTDSALHLLTLSTPSPAVPAASTVDKVIVSFAHGETGGNVHQTLVVTPGGGGGLCTGTALSTFSVPNTDTFDLTSCLSTPTKINGASFQYQTNLVDNGTSQTATASVDGVNLAVTSTDSSTRTLTLSNMAPAVPAGNTLDSLTLAVAHRETGASTSPTLVITPGGASACAPIALTPSAVLTTETVAIPANCLNTVAKVNGATYKYQVHLTDTGTAQNATANLDAVNLAVLSTDTTTHTLTLSNPSPPVPSTTAINSVTLSFAHQETGSGSTPTLVITPGGAAACTPIALTARASLTTDTVTVPANCLTTPARINGATYQYQVHLTDSGVPQSANVAVDGLALAVSSTDAATHTVTLSNLSNPVASGSTVSNATLSFAHQETGSGVNPTLLITPGGASACAPIPLTPRASVTTESIDVTACLNTAAKLNGAQIQYQAQLAPGGGGTASVDGARIDASAADGGTKQLTLSSMAAAPAIADTAHLSAATLSVTHGESAGTNPAVVVTPGGGSPCAAVSVPQHTAVTTDAIDVASCLTTGKQAKGATVAFQTHLTGGPANATAQLDAITMNATYTSRPTFPGACDPTSNGVQFIFSGDSHVYMPDGTAELCAGPPPNPAVTAQQIAVYGVPPTPPMTPSSVVSNPGGYTNTANAYQIGDSDNAGNGPLNATASGANKSITLGGFAAPAIPAGLSVKKVVARVSHGETGFSGSPKIQFTNALNQSCGSPVTLSSFTFFTSFLGPASDDDTTVGGLNLTNCFNSAAKLGGPGGDPTKLLATFTGPGGGSAGENLDGIELDVTLGRDPANPNANVLVPESGCVTTYPNYYDGYNSTDCAVWKWDSDEGGSLFPNPCSTAQPSGKACLPNAQVSIQGTVYTPGGVIDIDDQGLRDLSLSGCSGGAGTSCYAGVNYPLFNRGLIVRSLRFHAYKVDPLFHGPAIACNGGPCNGGTIPTERDLTLEAYVCAPGDDGCVLPGEPNPNNYPVLPAGARPRTTSTVILPLNSATPAQILNWSAS